MEAAYQGSKIFASSGQLSDLYHANAREAKIQARSLLSETLIGYSFFGVEWPLEPVNAFYNWLYIQALLDNPELSSRLSDYQVFTDIAFNPRKSFNCQARAAALFVGLQLAGKLTEAMQSKETFLKIVYASELATADSQISADDSSKFKNRRLRIASQLPLFSEHE